MNQSQDKKILKLKIAYFAILILTIALVLPTHIFSVPNFMPFRFPHYLELMQPIFGITWPYTFEIYHYFIYALIAVFVINLFGISHYPKFKNKAIFTSLFGIFLILLMILFFIFIFPSVNLLTSVIYGSYSAILLWLDVLTIKFLTTKQIEASF